MVAVVPLLDFLVLHDSQFRAFIQVRTGVQDLPEFLPLDPFQLHSLELLFTSNDSVLLDVFLNLLLHILLNKLSLVLGSHYIRVLLFN